MKRQLIISTFFLTICLTSCGQTKTETKNRAKDWKEVSELYGLLLNEKFDEIAARVK